MDLQRPRCRVQPMAGSDAASPSSSTSQPRRAARRPSKSSPSTQAVRTALALRNEQDVNTTTASSPSGSARSAKVGGVNRNEKDVNTSSNTSPSGSARSAKIGSGTAGIILGLAGSTEAGRPRRKVSLTALLKAAEEDEKVRAAERAKAAQAACEREALHDQLRSFDGRTDEEVDDAFRALVARANLGAEKKLSLITAYESEADARRRYSMLNEYSNYLRPSAARR